MNWLILTLVSAVAYAFAEIIGKYVSDEKSEPLFIGIISALFTTVTSLFFVAFEPIKLPSNIWAFGGLVASSAFVAIGIIAYYGGLKHSDISEFGLLSRTSILMRVLGGMLLFQERFSIFQSFGCVLILASIFSLSSSASSSVSGALAAGIKKTFPESINSFKNKSFPSRFPYAPSNKLEVLP